MPKRMVSKRELIGRKIVDFDPRPFDADPRIKRNKRTAHDPIITLDDGSRLYFVTEETEVGDYGVWIGRIKAKD